MEGVAVDIMGRIEKLSKLLCRSWRISLVYSINGLTRGQMVRRGSDAADSWDDPGKFLHWSSQTEDLEPSQLRDLKVSIFHIPVVIQKNLDLPMPF